MDEFWLRYLGYVALHYLFPCSCPPYIPSFDESNTDNFVPCLVATILGLVCLRGVGMVGHIKKQDMDGSTEVEDEVDRRTPWNDDVEKTAENKEQMLGASEVLGKTDKEKLPSGSNS